MGGQWQEKTCSLRFMLGEIPLFSVPLRAMRLGGHFSELQGDPDSHIGMLADLPEHVQALWVRSHPIQRDYPRLQRLGPAIRYVLASYNNYLTEVSGSFDDFLKRLGKKTLQERQRKIRRLKELCGGELDFREYRRPEQMAELYSVARAISVKTYQDRLLKVGFPEGPNVVQSLEGEAAKDQVRSWVLFLNGTPLAYQHARLHNGIVMGQYLGYDPEYRKFSPGAILHFCLLERLFTEGGYTVFDYGQGEGEHKESYATTAVRCADIYYLRPRAGLAMLASGHLLSQGVSTAAGRTLQALGLKRALKSFLRRKA